MRKLLSFFVALAATVGVSASSFGQEMARTPSAKMLSPMGTLAKVGTSSISVIGANASRRGIIFANPSETRTITLVPGNQVAVSGKGILIKPLGERWFFGDGKLIKFNSAWNAIADDGADNPLEIIELR
jgi:hypothetical protein